METQSKITKQEVESNLAQNENISSKSEESLMESSNNLHSKNKEANMNENIDFRNTVNPDISEKTNNSQNISTGDSAYTESTQSGTPSNEQVDGDSHLSGSIENGKTLPGQNQSEFPIVAYTEPSVGEDISGVDKTETQLKKSPVRQFDTGKVAQIQVNRLRKETKLMRLKKELKDLKAAIKRGYVIRKKSEKVVESDGRILERVYKKNQPLDPASKMLIQNKCVKKEAEIFDLQEVLKNLKREIRHKASNNLHAARNSFARRKKEVNRSKLINRYKSWLTEASNNGGRSLISQAVMLSKQGEIDQAREKIITVLTSTRIKNHPRTKSAIEFDEEIEKELLNHLNKIIL